MPDIISTSPPADTWALSSEKALAILLVARLFSASLNLIHDCDEVFNYWEPLHYLLYEYGYQTWEYSSKFALRSWLYIILHKWVAAPVAWLCGNAAGKVAVFKYTRSVLGAACACTESLLYRAVLKSCGPRTAGAMLIMLLASSGMFVASTTLLPSTFAMYALTTASAAVIDQRPFVAIVAAGVGVLWGWVVAAVAFLPHAVLVLYAASVPKALTVATAVLAVLFAAVAVVDRRFYGSWQVSLLNFVRYNVVGGGQSALYGVEGPAYYLKTGILAFNLALPLALLLPTCTTVQWLLFNSNRPEPPRADAVTYQPVGSRSIKAAQTVEGSSQNFLTRLSSSSHEVLDPMTGKSKEVTCSPTTVPMHSEVPASHRTDALSAASIRIGNKSSNYARMGLQRVALALAVAPLWLWLSALSCLPHKEERFLYVVYPLVCMAAAMALEAIITTTASLWPEGLHMRARAGVLATMRIVPMVVIVALSLSRIAALHTGYSAPMALYSSLPEEQPSTARKIVPVCVADEWYRFPSSFFLPGPSYRLQFLASPFDGHLPRPFNRTEGGTKAAPWQLNDRNRKEPANYWNSSMVCSFFTGCQLPSDAKAYDWEVISKQPFLDHTRSPLLTRALYIPYFSPRRNNYKYMFMWRRRV